MKPIKQWLLVREDGRPVPESNEDTESACKKRAMEWASLCWEKWEDVKQAGYDVRRFVLTPEPEKKRTRKGVKRV